VVIKEYQSDAEGAGLLFLPTPRILQFRPIGTSRMTGIVVIV
jgi:hypothetical protein